jgi:hypothetical protein
VGPIHLRLKQALCAPYSYTSLKEPCSFTRVPDGPHTLMLTSSGFGKKEPRCAGLSETKASHSHRTWTEVSSSVTHFLQVGLLLNPITYRCLLRVLCLVRRPVMTLDWVLLKDSNQVFVAVLGHQMLVIHPACNLIIDILPRVPKGWLRPYKLLSGTAPCELVDDFISMYPCMSSDPV